MGACDTDRALDNRLPGSEVHLWLLRLAAVPELWPQWEEVLNDAERVKAARFSAPGDRTRSAVSRARLRRILGDYLGIAPAGIGFDATRHGRPVLAERFRSGRINFSVSHSHDYLLLGFVVGRPIGVDIERTKVEPPFAALAREICSTAELRELESLPKHAQTEALYECWTLKEAYTKALGVGLAYPPRRVGLTLRKGQEGAPFPAWVMRVRGVWRTFVIRDLPDYAAAMVTTGQPSVVVRSKLEWEGGCGEREGREGKR